MTNTELHPTAEQAAAIELFTSGLGLAIEAGAGTGKTSTLQLLAESTDRRGQYIAFNRAIVEDARARFPRTVAAATAHSLAFRAVGRRYAHRLETPRMRSHDIARRLSITAPLWLDVDGGRKGLQPSYLASAAMKAITAFCFSADKHPGPQHVAHVDGIDEPHAHTNNQILAHHLTPFLQRAWDDITDPEGALPFKHDHYLKIWERQEPRIAGDFILFDEAQDASPVMISIIEQQTNAQQVWVGDVNQQVYAWRGSVNAMAAANAAARTFLTQCQPAGTMVRVPVQINGREWSHSEVPIETLAEGDLVVTWKPKRGLRPKGERIADVAVRQHDGPIIVARAGNKTSRYADNHECVIVLGPSLDEGSHVVYLMRKDGQYRIGRAPWLYSNGNGPLRRARAQSADGVWILSVHPTIEQAALYEALTQVQFGIPAMTFTEDHHYKMDLAEFWIKIGDNRRQAEGCLRHHRLLIDQPLWSAPSGDNRPGGGWHTQLVTAAANLRSGMRMLVPGSSGRTNGSPGGYTPWSAWTPITVGTEWYSGPIYSLSVDVDHTYVADGIVTHNSFRFGQPIADVANIVLEIVDADLRLTGHPDIESTVAPHLSPHAVLTRSNACAIETLMTRQAEGRRPHLVGGGTEVATFARAARDLQERGSTDYHELACFDSWAAVQAYVADDPQGSDLRLSVSLVDRFGVDAILRAIEAMPGQDQADLIVSTAHKSKGREWSTVQLAEDFGLPGDDGEAEWKLLYVAATRARHVLDLTACEPLYLLTHGPHQPSLLDDLDPYTLDTAPL